MKCYICPSENVIAHARACVDCIEKTRIEVIEASQKCMDLLDRNIIHCVTQAEYKSNRNQYNHHRLEIAYNTSGINGIPRPAKRKKTQREKSNIFLE